MDKIYLGNTTQYGRLYLSKHSWDCGWYWGFGYIGNNSCHLHIESLIGGEYDVNKIFNKGTKIKPSQWWIIRDLFKQAYALKRAAEVYQCGGRQTTQPGITDCIKNEWTAKLLNEDLRIVLDKVWDFITNEVKR